MVRNVPEKPISLPLLMDLENTLDCGQAFRWRRTEEENPFLWEGTAFDAYLRLEQKGKTLLLYCGEEDFQRVWRSYFDLETDYEEKCRRISGISPVLAEACSFAPGIRLLCQDPWEALCSFIISQNNNIPRIKGIIKRLCALLGKPIPGTGFHTFPRPEALAACTVEDLTPLRAGFRAKYLIDAGQKVENGLVNLAAIKELPLNKAREELRKITGVGPKVAECTLLYGFHRTACFPMDVWMKRAMEVLLPRSKPEDFGEDAGLVQQVLFHYSRMHPQLFQNNHSGSAD